MNAWLERLFAWAGPRVPVMQAVLLFGIGTVILAAGVPVLVDLGGDLLPPTSPLRLCTLAVLCGAELLRQRAPGVALTIALVVGGVELTFGVTLATLLVVTDLLFAATVFGSRRTNQLVVWGSGAVVLVLVVLSIMTAHGLRDVVTGILQVCSLPLIPVWWGMNVRHHREAAAAERARADQLARIAELDRDAAVQAERARMARDLHDVIAGHLSAIAIQSEAVLSMVDGDPVAMRRVLKSVRENSVQSLTEMRAMIHLLRSSDESAVEHTAPARLRDIAQLLESARAAGLVVDADTNVDAELPVAVDLSAYRIVQEALTNAVKHAPGARASVTVGRRESTLVVEVVNERTDSFVEGGVGRGLLNMRERAQAVGGMLVAGPHERMWRVRAELPAEGT
ncbi:sensor histidine kinase [Actinophytocola sp.]|uniref:sensor histidine kinase n=1 Tax=Actinophytocola sp. TaxID=1872138 RepID=UPI002ED23B1D